MKFKVFEGKEKKEEETYFKLVEYDNNHIDLIAVNSQGHEILDGIVLTLSEKGICLRSDLNQSLGIKLDDEGMVNITSNY